MRPETYEKIRRWFLARPDAHYLLRAAYKALPVFVALLYAALLAQCYVNANLWRLADIRNFREGTYFPVLSEADILAYERMRWAVLLVPAAVLGIGSVLRRVINAPRPYEKGIRPLLPKQTKGQSLPSRHALSAAVITAAAVCAGSDLWPMLAVLTLLICATRVLAGVHSVADVLAGVALGGGLGWLGIQLVTLL